MKAEIVLQLLKSTLLTIKLAKNLREIKNGRVKKRKPKRFWVREFLKQRKVFGAYHTLIPKLLNPDANETRPEAYINYFRMSPATMDKLLEKVSPYIQKACWVREPISPGERLCMTIRYLASGDSMKSIAYQYRVGYSTVSIIIKETTEAIWNALHEEVLPINFSEEYWRTKAQEFNERWNFPHCCGAFDGKHVNIQAFNNAGSNYFNYKGSHSIVLMALADANYKFITIDVGAEGRFSDGGVFKTWNFGKAIHSQPQLLNLPPPEPLPDSDKITPFVFVGDEAFPLLPNLMRPYPGRNSENRMPRDQAIFNYRISRARRIVENVFGIWANTWRIFRRPIQATSNTVSNIVKSCVVLQNFLINEEPTYVSRNLREIVSNPRAVNNGVTSISGSGSNRPTTSGTMVRDTFKDYFVNEGAVNWQEEHIFNAEIQI